VGDTLKLKEQHANLYELVDDAMLVYDPESTLVLDANERACEKYDLRNTCATILLMAVKHPSNGPLVILNETV
jgi:hypothetical protein